jgi:hypothetical protein
MLLVTDDLGDDETKASHPSFHNTVTMVDTAVKKNLMFVLLKKSESSED